MAIHLWGISQAEQSVERAEQRLETKAETVEREAESSESLGYALGLLGWAIAASVFVAVKVVEDEMPAWSIAFGRVLITALVMTPFLFAHFHEARAFLRKHWLHALVIGSLGLGFAQGLMLNALHLTTAVNAGIVFALSPILTLVFARLVLREAMSSWQGFGALIAFSGVVTVTVQGDINRLASLQIGTGEIFAFCAACCFAAYTIALKKANFQLGRLTLLAVLLMGGVIGTAPFALYEYLSGAHDNLTRNGYFALIYCAVIGGAVLYALFNWSVDILGAGRAGTLVYSQPIFIAILAWILLGERLEWYHYLGAAIVTLGVVIVLTTQPKPTPQKSPG
ncbi:MAG: DMT family transporter [Pseudomonadota bacterium]